MFNFMKSKLFNAQVVRTIGCTTYQGAEIGECLAASQKIKENDKESWYQEWSLLGDKNFNDAQNWQKNSFPLSARYGFLRACSYYRTAYFFLEDNNSDKRIEEALDKSILSFHNAIALLDYPVQIVTIPYNNTTLPGYLYLQPHKAPIIITCAGGDGTKEESYMTATEAYSRGYHCLTFEGPGQGSVLRKQRMTLIPEWENVVEKVIDFLYTYPEIDRNNIIYLGKSFGGFLAARAITGEKRISACVMDPGQFDQFSNIEKNFTSHYPGKPIDEILQNIIDSPDFDKSFMIKSRLWRYGATNPKEFVERIPHYTLKGLVKNISCPVMIFDNEEEYLSLGQAKILFDQLQCTKDYHLFTASEQTGGHCEPLIPRIFFSKAFEWIKKHENKE